MELLSDPHHASHIWYTISFVIFAGILVKFGVPAFNKMLDGRIEQIKKDLEEAENLRIEAQEMLAQYQRKHRDAVQESETIIKNARESARQFKDKAEADLNDMMERREHQLQERLERMKQNAINEIQEHAAGLAMSATRHIITEKLDKKAKAKLVDEAIGNIEANIH
ncbi:MAG: F0F1 ATP synthase subunit B [Alcanivorax sp.]